MVGSRDVVAITVQELCEFFYWTSCNIMFSFLKESQANFQIQDILHQATYVHPHA